MSRFLGWSWWKAWRMRSAGCSPRELEPADLGTAFGLEASLQAEAMFGLPAPWARDDPTARPADDRASYSR